MAKFGLFIFWDLATLPLCKYTGQVNVLPAGLMVMFKSGCESSDEVCNKILLPRSHVPAPSSNLNAEHPMVDMHIVVQCSEELEIK